MPTLSTGLRPHTHAQRQAVVDGLIPLWQQKFGEKLIAIAASASFARGEDCAYSDLEMEVFVKEKPASPDEGYLQRVVDGMLVEVIYRTPEEFLRERSGIAPHWHMSASDRLAPVYNAPFIEELMAQVQAAQQAAQSAVPHSAGEFLRAATRQRFELQESFSKVLNAVEQNNVEGVSLLLMDAVLHLLHVLALVNRRPFVTFARYIHAARSFEIKPERFDDLLDLLVEGRYTDLQALGEIALAVFTGVEHIFAERGIQLYADPLDPNLPNRPVLEAEKP